MDESAATWWMAVPNSSTNAGSMALRASGRLNSRWAIESVVASPTRSPITGPPIPDPVGRLARTGPPRPRARRT
ncbi:hypothetical protein ACFFX0_21040 [Citricoccus parietis]|uniref:Uncharacterized protein n=1 Tax=Citricoccus parietis TaxID=592307 RepID=A0ABV5G3P5_9MICC